jgi:hypothetical protein
LDTTRQQEQQVEQRQKEHQQQHQQQQHKEHGGTFNTFAALSHLSVPLNLCDHVLVCVLYECMSEVGKTANFVQRILHTDLVSRKLTTTTMTTTTTTVIRGVWVGSNQKVSQCKKNNEEEVRA